MTKQMEYDQPENRDAIVLVLILTCIILSHIEPWSLTSTDRDNGTNTTQYRHWESGTR